MNQDSWSISDPQTLEFAGVAEVKVALVKGRFDIVVTEGPTATLEISEVDGQPLEVSFSNGTLKVEHFNASNWLQRLINFQQGATRRHQHCRAAGNLCLGKHCQWRRHGQRQRQDHPAHSHRIPHGRRHRGHADPGHRERGNHCPRPPRRPGGQERLRGSHGFG